MIIPKIYQPVWWWLTNDKPPYRNIMIDGGRASGKSTTVAQSLVCEAATRPIMVLCAREFQNSINDSVYKLLAEQIEALGLTGYTLKQDSITHANGSSFIFRGLHNNLQSLKSIEGIDVCWVEEAQTITMESLNVLIPTIRKPDSIIICTWNPLTETDPVMRRFVTEATEETLKQTIHIHSTWHDIKKLLNQTILDLIEADKNTPTYDHVWEGKPLTNTLNQIVTWDMLNDATKRECEDGPTTFGVDVARYGNDRTALAIIKGNQLHQIIPWRHRSITDTADIITKYAVQYQPIQINVDDTGVGGGLTDILKTRHLPVTGINYASKAKSNNYPNVASELWFDFAEQLPTMSINPQLKHLSDLTQELTTREWQLNSKNQRQVQAKKDYKNNNNVGSPDLADAVLLAAYKPLKLPSWDITI